MSADRRILLMAGLIVVVVGACNGLSPPVTVEPPLPTPTPIECTANPPGLALRVDSLGNRRVRISGEGFQPGEALVLIFSAQVGTSSAGKAIRHEVRPAQAVGNDGTFTWEERMQPLDGSVMWHLAVVHARGGACVTFAAP